MSTADLARLSDTLVWPTAFVLYVAAMLAYAFRLALTVARPDGTAARPRSAVVVGRLGVVLVSVGLAAHLSSIVTRSLASGGRVPWGNMYEYSSAAAFGIVAVALFFVHARLRRPEIVGFLILAALLTLGSGLALYTPSGPLQPILVTNWIKVHTLSAMASSSIFTVAFVFTGLYLIRDLAERRVAARHTAGHAGSTVGAYAAGSGQTLTDEAIVAADAEAAGIVGLEEGGVGGAPEVTTIEHDASYGRALRRAISPLPIALAAAAIALAYSLLFRNPIASIVAPSVLFVGVLAGWLFLPALPSAATLDAFAYRTTAFAFPLWTFAVLTGAIWAEQSWGRYWGWDPKETGAFVTWVGYAAYLHARATRGVRGRRAAVIGVVAFLMLMFTYYAVNLWIAGLHSYQGTDTRLPPLVGIGGAIAVAGLAWYAGRRANALPATTN